MWGTFPPRWITCERDVGDGGKGQKPQPKPEEATERKPEEAEEQREKKPNEE